jgi:hypothetical protein
MNIDPHCLEHRADSISAFFDTDKLDFSKKADRQTPCLLRLEPRDGGARYASRDQKIRFREVQMLLHDYVLCTVLDRLPELRWRADLHGRGAALLSGHCEHCNSEERQLQPSARQGRQQRHGAWCMTVNSGAKFTRRLWLRSGKGAL